MAADRERYAMNYYVSRGYKPWQAAGIVGNLIQESSLNTGARNPGDGRDGSDSIGIGQWNGDRARALRRFAGSRGKDVTDFDTQLAFVEHELGGSESRAGRALRASTDVHGATAAMIGFERPAGWSLNNPTGGHGWGNRFSHARRLSGMGGSELVDAVASRGDGQAKLVGDAGNDRLEPQSAGGTPSSGSSSPTVNIAIPPEQKARAELLDAVVKRGMDMGSNAKNGWDVLGGLAQVWAGSSEQKKLEGTENAALTGALAGLDPEYQMAAQLLGGREGAAQAILSQQEARTSAANRAEARADRLSERDYRRSQDEIDNARADAALDLQRQGAERDGLQPGWRWNADKTAQEPIPGGPADPTVRAGNGFRTLTPAEITELGLPPGSYQRGPDGKIDDIGKAGQTIVVGGGENKQVFDAMAESAASARSAATGLNGLTEAKRALNAGIISGAGADTILGLQKVGAWLGVTDPSAIQNTETFRAAIAPQVAAVMKATVGTTNISNSDREFAEKAAGGNITLDAGSINKLVDIMDRAARATIAGHRARLDKVYPTGSTFDRERALFEIGEPAPLPTGDQSGSLVPGQDTDSTPTRTNYKQKYGLE